MCREIEMLIDVSEPLEYVEYGAVSRVSGSIAYCSPARLLLLAFFPLLGMFHSKCSGGFSIRPGTVPGATESLEIRP